ncbi:MAG: hypothetical protein KAX78_01860 [Phycisphaerae bacterium]|nr:hypothetical protein [Phycisphaerae bacterium]
MFVILGLFCCGFLVALLAVSQYEGFGSRSVGGQGKRVFWVDPELGDSGSDKHRIGTPEFPCCLRKALSGGDRIIKFTRGGTITLDTAIYIQNSHITIDGASAPEPGITITHTHERHGGVIFGCPGKHIHDFIISHIRFQGLWAEDPRHVSGYTILGIYVDDPDGEKVSDVVYDHLTFCGLQDKSSIWGNVANVTVSWCMFYDSHMSSLVSMHSRKKFMPRIGVTFHHNLWAHSKQRNPQLRNWIENLEVVNNIMYGWEFYGMRIKNEPGEKPVNANVVNNVFCSDGRRPDSALIYGWDPGPDYADRAKASDFPQGTVYTDNEMGELYVAGNILPPANRDQYSTVEAPLEIPDWARVKTVPAEQVGHDVLPDVGMMYRSEHEQELIAKAAKAIGTEPA